MPAATLAKEDTCTCCGEDLRHYPEDPSTDENGEPMCEICWHEEFEFTCMWCHDYGMKKHQHNMLVIAEPEGLKMLGADEVQAGVYRITDTPYYASWIFGAHLYGQSLKRLADVPEDLDSDYFHYPCGHLCMGCQEKITEATD